MSDELLKEFLYSDTISTREKLAALKLKRPDIVDELRLEIEAEIEADLGLEQTFKERMKRLVGIRKK